MGRKSPSIAAAASVVGAGLLSGLGVAALLVRLAGVYLLEGSEFVHADASRGAVLIVVLLVLHWPAAELARRVG